MKHKRFLCTILSAAFLIGFLSGCNKEEAASQEPTAATESSSAFAYRPTFAPVTTHTGEALQWVDSWCVSGGKVFYSGSYQDGMIQATNELTGEPIVDENGNPVEYENFVQGIFLYDPTDGNVSLLEGYTPAEVPEGMNGSSHIGGILAGADNTIWVYEEVYTYYFDVPEGYAPQDDENIYDYYVEGEQKKLLSQYSSTGDKLTDLTLRLENDVYLSDIYLTSDSVVAYDYQNVYVFDLEGNPQNSISAESVSGNLYQLREDEIVCCTYDETTQGMALKQLDLIQGTFTDRGHLPSGSYQVYPGHDDYDYLYSINDSVFGYRASTDTSEKLFFWLDCDVNSNNIEEFYFLPDGSIVALERDYSGSETQCNLIVMKLTDVSAVPQKQELTLGCLYLDYDLRNIIVEFNRSHTDVRIVVRDYAELITDEDYETAWNAALQKLNTEILSGSMPDLLCTNNLPIEQYVSKDLLIDLWPMIDSDPELSREDLMTHFFDVLSVDGKLYQVTDTFAIQTAIVNSDIAAGRTSWTLDELLEARGTLQEGASIFGEYDTSEYILQSMISFDLESFMDWDTLSCSFDSPEFIDILNFANQFPKEFDSENYDWDTAESEYTRLKTGKQLMMQGGLYSFDDLQFHSGVFEGEASYIGFPSSTGCGSCFTFSGGLAIAAACSNPEAAWQFVRTLLLEDTQVEEYMYNFPTNRHAFEVYKEQAMTPEYTTDPETGAQIEVSTGGIGFNDFMVELYSVKQEDFDAFWSVYENCSRISTSNEEVMSLISGHAEAFFAGQKTAEETAKLIQDGVSLYMMEQG